VGGTIVQSKKGVALGDCDKDTSQKRVGDEIHSEMWIKVTFLYGKSSGSSTGGGGGGKAQGTISV